jgi:hypothetical protein
MFASFISFLVVCKSTEDYLEQERAETLESELYAYAMAQREEISRKASAHLQSLSRPGCLDEGAREGSRSAAGRSRRRVSMDPALGDGAGENDEREAYGEAPEQGRGEAWPCGISANVERRGRHTSAPGAICMPTVAILPRLPVSWCAASELGCGERRDRVDSAACENSGQGRDASTISGHAVTTLEGAQLALRSEYLAAAAAKVGLAVLSV